MTFSNLNFGIRGVVVTEAGSYLRLIDSCITQLKAQGTSRTCDESKEEEATLTLTLNQAIGGVATFTDLSINVAQPAYRLLYSTGLLGSIQVPGSPC